MIRAVRVSEPPAAFFIVTPSKAERKRVENQRGVRTFTLTSQGEVSVEFTTHEKFSGLLLPLFGGSIPDMPETFENFAAGLKSADEGV